MRGMESVHGFKTERNLKVAFAGRNCRHRSGFTDRPFTDGMVYRPYFDWRDAFA